MNGVKITYTETTYVGEKRIERTIDMEAQDDSTKTRIETVFPELVKNTLEASTKGSQPVVKKRPPQPHPEPTDEFGVEC